MVALRLPKMSSGQVRALQAGTDPGRAAIAEQVTLERNPAIARSSAGQRAARTGLPSGILRNDVLRQPGAPTAHSSRPIPKWVDIIQKRAKGVTTAMLPCDVTVPR